MQSLLSVIFLLIFSFQAPADEGTGGSLLDAKNKSEKLNEEEQSILERHYPFYFAYGRPTSKLQLSFKSPLIRENWPTFLRTSTCDRPFGRLSSSI